MVVSEYIADNKPRGTNQREAGPTPRRRTAAIHSAVAVACLLLSALAVHQTAGKVPDDAFIMFRYAQNLLDGHGWVFNLHHPTTNAVSAPLYTLALTLLALLLGNVELASALLFVFTTAASGYLAFAILHRNSLTLGGLAAMCLMILNPWLLATQGLESSTFVCLLLLSVLLQGAGKHAGLGLVLVAATLVRGDGAVFAAVIFGVLCWRAKRFPWRLMMGATAATTVWSITALIYRVPIIPDTLAAKVAQGRSGLWGDMLYLRGSAVLPKVFGFMEWATAAALLAGTGLLLLGGLRELRRYLGPFILGVGLLFAAYGLIIRPPSYHWYYGPQLALMAICGGAAIAVIARAAAVNMIESNGAKHSSQLGRRLARLQIATPRRAGIVALTVAVLMSGTMSVVGWLDIIRGPDRPEYLDTASWLRDNTPGDATIALSEIGIVGWYSQRDMVDFLGLLSRDSVNEIANRDPVSWLSREEPDYWIVHQPQWSGMEAAASEPWFSLAYQPVWTNGSVVVWKHYRAIAEAKRLVETLVEPTASQICDQLEVPASDLMTRRAITALVALFGVRDDLQATYSSSGRFDLAGLIAWAVSPAVNDDQYGAAVQQHVPAYEEIAPGAASAEFRIPPTTT